MRWKRIDRRLLTAVGMLFILGGVGAWWVFPEFVDFKTAFRWSKPALDDYAAKVIATGPAMLATPPKRIGYINVLTMEPLPHGFVFQHDKGHPFDWSGLAYSTEPLPSEDKDARGKVIQTFTPLGDNWYDVFRP